MKSIGKARIVTKEELLAQLQEQHAAVNEAIRTYNEEMKTRWAAVESVIATCNQTVAIANAFMSEIADDIDDYMAEKSDAWQEGDRGQAYAAWAEEYRNEIEEVDVSEPDWVDDIDAETGPAQFDELLEEPNT